MRNTAHTATPWYSTPSGMICTVAQVDAVATVHQHGANMASRNEALATADFIVRACNAHEELVLSLQQAIERIKLANLEGDPILSAWLPEAEAALAKAQA